MRRAIVISGAVSGLIRWSDSTPEFPNDLGVARLGTTGRAAATLRPTRRPAAWRHRCSCCRSSPTRCQRSSTGRLQCFSRFGIDHRADGRAAHTSGRAPPREAKKMDPSCFAPLARTATSYCRSLWLWYLGRRAFRAEMLGVKGAIWAIELLAIRFATAASTSRCGSLVRVRTCHDLSGSRRFRLR